MTKHKWNALGQPQTKKKLFDSPSLLLLLCLVLGAVFSLIQLRLMSQHATEFLTFSAAVRPSGMHISANQLNDKTTSIFISDKFVTIANLKNMLSLSDKKEFLMLPRNRFLQSSRDVDALKLQFPKLTKQVAILVDPKIGDDFKDWANLQQIQSQLNLALQQDHTFLIAK